MGYYNMLTILARYDQYPQPRPPRRHSGTRSTGEAWDVLIGRQPQEPVACRRERHQEAYERHTTDETKLVKATKEWTKYKNIEKWCESDLYTKRDTISFGDRKVVGVLRTDDDLCSGRAVYAGWSKGKLDETDQYKVELIVSRFDEDGVLAPESELTDMHDLPGFAPHAVVKDWNLVRFDKAHLKTRSRHSRSYSNIWRSGAKTRSDDAITLGDSSDSSMPKTPKGGRIAAPSSGRSKQKTETQNPSAAGTQMTARPRQLVAVGKVRVMFDDGTFGDLLVCARLHKPAAGSKYGEKIKYFYDSHPASMAEKLSSLMADDDTSEKPRGAPPTFVWLDKYAMTANGKSLGLAPRRDHIGSGLGFSWGLITATSGRESKEGG
ncbi:hypothetical protein LTR56_003432 [Elasticomyces elasticus]|nr:hypothetical protein LTR22_010908 [Elasticomyces elasticus]KAK3655426.1 hypothetical protein LTR56_003432 [Elasticomyces elasticus]KAK4919937.1 hypothetical protein LTR49_012535 [Elasticomyces elasticus]KAK5733066.1 hypothetical protein LTS12_027012 [Elasticomyces elasticus]